MKVAKHVLTVVSGASMAVLVLLDGLSPTVAHATATSVAPVNGITPGAVTSADGHPYQVWTDSQALAASPSAQPNLPQLSITPSVLNFSAAVDAGGDAIRSELGSSFSSMAIDPATGLNLIVRIAGSVSQVTSPTLASLDTSLDHVILVDNQQDPSVLTATLNSVLEKVQRSQRERANSVGTFDITAISRDDLAGRIVVSVPGSVSAATKALNGIPNVLVRTAPPVQTTDNQVWGNNPARSSGPIAGGESIASTTDQCTSAFPATRGGTPVLITAGHCVENTPASPPPGSPWYQASVVNGSTNYGTRIGIPYQGTPHYADGSLIDVAAIVSTDHGTSNCIVVVSLPCSPIANRSLRLAQGSAVAQTGARTGNTYTTVQSVNAPIYNTVNGITTRVIADGISTYACSLPGDSGGALWVQNADGTVTPMGTLNGTDSTGSTCASSPHSFFQNWSTACPTIGIDNCPTSSTPAAVSISRTADDKGYWTTSGGGHIIASGDAGFFGDLQGYSLNRPIVSMAATPSGAGYWLVASDGGIFSYGNAGFHGSMGGQLLNKPIVGMASTSSGNGYWLVASDGGLFAFGDAGFYGSTGGTTLNQPVVGMAATSDSAGYWLVASDGGIFAYGDAAFHGSTGGTTLNKPVVGMAATSDGGGYWLDASDGGVFAFGNATFHGSTGSIRLNQPVVGMASTSDGQGYWLVASDRGIFNFGDAGFYGGATVSASVATTNNTNLIYAKVTNTLSGNVVIHWLSASTGYQGSDQHAATSWLSADVSANGYIVTGDFNGDGVPDAFYIKVRNTVSGLVEVSILSGASGYQTLLLNVVTPFNAADVSANGRIQVADVDGDGKADLVYVKTKDTASGKVKLLVLPASYQYTSHESDFVTSQVAADVVANGQIQMSDFDGDGKADMVFVKTAGTPSGNVELHIKSGSSGYQSSMYDAATALFAPNAQSNGIALVGGSAGESTADLLFAMTSNAPTSSIEVFNMPKTSSYGTILDLGSIAWAGSDVLANGTLSLSPK